MTAGQTTLLGAFAGATIFLGLPLGRVQGLSAWLRGFLTMLSAGILLFIFFDVMSQASDVVDGAIARGHHGGSWVPFGMDAVMLMVGFVVGVAGLAWSERQLHRRRRPLAPMAGGSVEDAALAGLDVAALAEQARRSSLALGMMIATAIGIHNFSEGLAIGVAARAGEVALAGTLIVGFALHNATEGFGIVGPLGDVRPSWRWIGLAGLVGGGPTFLGATIGYRVSSKPLQLAFLSLAAGAILFVVGELWNGSSRRASRGMVLTGLVIGFLIAYGSDLVITLAGV
jgi:zinc transporter, ZIP family